MGDLKLKYWKFRDEIQWIPEDTPDTDLGLDRPKGMFTLFPQKFVEQSDRNTEIVKRDISESQEGITVERCKSRDRGSMVRTVSYANIMKGNILPK